MREYVQRHLVAARQDALHDEARSHRLATAGRAPHEPRRGLVGQRIGASRIVGIVSRVALSPLESVRQVLGALLGTPTDAS
jgi:hypothetical protein